MLLLQGDWAKPRCRKGKSIKNLLLSLDGVLLILNANGKQNSTVKTKASSPARVESKSFLPLLCGCSLIKLYKRMSSLKRFTGNSCPCFIMWNSEILNYIRNHIRTIKGSIFSSHSHLTWGTCFRHVRWSPGVLAGFRKEFSRSQTLLQTILKAIIKVTKASSDVSPDY